MATAHMQGHTTRQQMRPAASLRLAAGLFFGVRALVVCALVLPVGAAAAPWDFAPRVALGQTWTDNVNLSESEVEESEWITELKPGFTLSTEGPRSRVSLDYDLQALWFADNSDFDDVYHQLNGDGNFVIAPESLFVDAFARYDQQNVDSGGRVAYSNVFNTGNRTDTFVFGASPYHVGRWGNWGESLVRYQYQGVRYNNTDDGTMPPEDSDTNAVSAALGSPLEARGFSWRVNGNYTLTEFDEADEFEYARVALDVGVPVGFRTRLLATVGQESDVEEDQTKGGLDSSFWYVGFLWEPSDLQSLEARVGERFFGTAWEVHWRRRGSRGEVGIDYTEEPTTSAGVLGNESIFVPDTGPVGVGTLDTRVFLQKRLSANANYRIVRSILSARIYTDRREYQDTGGGSESAYGATLSFDWEAAARTRVGLTAEWEQRDFESDRRDDFGDFTFRVTRELTRTLSASLRASHFLRDSDSDANIDYNVNQVSLFLEARF